MSERQVKATNAPLITRPGESKEFLGTRNVVDFLPQIFQTTVNKSFLDTTLEQLMSSGSLLAVSNYVGSTQSRSATEDYHLTNRSYTDAVQFVTGAVNKDADQNITQALSYDDLVNQITVLEDDAKQHNNSLNEQGYTLNLPINYDMFINYHKYFWLVDTMQPCDLVYNFANPLTNIDDIIGLTYYTTPTLDNGKTLELQNGMRIRFKPIRQDVFHQSVVGNTTFTLTINGATYRKVYVDNIIQTEGVDYTVVGTTLTLTSAPALTTEVQVDHYWANGTNYHVGDIYIVDGIGTEKGLCLTRQFESSRRADSYEVREFLSHTVYTSQEPSTFDGDNQNFDFDPYDIREFRNVDRDYVCEQRFATDSSAWARTNNWIHETAAQAALDFQGEAYSDWLAEPYRAVRPIIEFRANIEKYNFGTRHIHNVTHLHESTADPATTIVGQTAWTHMGNITNNWTIGQGYVIGEKVKFTLGGETSYYECAETHGESYNPTYFENRRWWRQINPLEVQTGDTILFLGTTNTTYANKIFRVGGVSTSITLTEVYGPSSTALVSGDKILVVHGYNDEQFNNSESTKPYEGSEWHWDGTAWNYSSQKMHKSAGLPIQLYDIDGVKLDDTTTYPESTFTGDGVFDYGKSSTSPVDHALGFSPSYVDYGNTPGLDFAFGAGAIRYNYVIFDQDNDVKVTKEIPGYYFYKNLDTNRYENTWSLIRNAQPVKRHAQKIVDADKSTVQFDLGTTDVAIGRTIRFTKRLGQLVAHYESPARMDEINGQYPTLYMSRNKNYDIKTQFFQSEIEFVNFDGTALGAGITRTAGTGDDFQLQIVAPTYDAFKYRLTASPNTYGMIYLDDNTADYNFVVTKNSVVNTTDWTYSNGVVTVNTNALATDDVWEVTWHSDSTLSDTADGEFMPADTHIYNPQNKKLSTASFGDMIEHMRDQMESMPGFTGDYFGDNNYNKRARVHEYGGTIRQQPFSTELIGQMNMDTDTHAISSLKYASNSYRRFKNQFTQKMQQLHNTVDITTPVYELVDRALEEITIGKDANSPFANSNMAMFKEYESVLNTYHPGPGQTWDLPHAVSTYDDAKNHVQVFVSDNGVWRQLEKSEYTLTAYNVTITTTFPNSSPFEIRWYPQNAVSYIPSSAVKLGLIKPYQPSSNLSYGVDSAILGHDGSIHIKTGSELYDRTSSSFDIVSAALWDLELRIWNNLQDDFSNIIEYEHIMPNANIGTPHSWTDLNNALENDWVKFKARNSITTLTPAGYFTSDEFTWNYSSVGPGIAGYKGLYNYYFNTDRPHITPWEMFGYHIKPAWWDTHYSWSAGPKRTALISALKFGLYNDPSQPAKQDPRWSYRWFDWSANDLVTTAGVLNGPVTSGLVSAPTAINRAKDFVFGDWGPVEDQWRRSSEGKIALFTALMKIRPLWITNTFFSSNKRKIKQDGNWNTPIIYNSDFNQLIDHTKPLLSSTTYEGGIIESVRIADAGSGYINPPVLKVYDNFGSGATLRAYVTSAGTIRAVEVTNPGSNYFSKPVILQDPAGNGSLEAVIKQNAKRYFIGLSNAMVEYAKFNNTSVTQLTERFSRLDFSPILKTGGFINAGGNQFILESSQDKGSVVIPEENAKIVLYNSKPVDELFIGGITVTKTSTGYKINGFDNETYQFVYYNPNTGSMRTTVTQDSVSVIRYAVYDTIEQTLDYNDEFYNVQEVYNFILGYGEYLKSKGYDANWRSQGVNFVAWAAGDMSTPITLMPNSESIVVPEPSRGYYDNIENKYDAVYNLVDINGKQISSDSVVFLRNTANKDQTTSIIVKDSTKTAIYGIRLYIVETEHTVVFDNNTDFDDTVYDSALGQRHTRIIWKGSKTKNWNGKLHAPGYIITSDDVIENFDTVARELDQYYGKTNTISNKQIADVAKFNSGYNKADWATQLKLDDDTAFDLYKGGLKYQGTRYSLDAFMKNKALFGADATANLFEEWAVRTADYGDVRSRDTIEFELNTTTHVTSPQPIRFNADTTVVDALTDLTIDISNSSDLLVTGDVNNVFTTRPARTYTKSTISDEAQYAGDFITAGLPLTNETDYRVLTKDHFTQFPTPANDAYIFDGEWQDIDQWDNKTSYKFNDKVIYVGRVWEMVDPDGASGLNRPNDPISVTGTITLPTISSSGGTLIIDGTSVQLTKSVQSTTNNVINVIGTNNIGGSSLVTNGSTVIFGESSGVARTVTFSNSVTTTTFNNIVKNGTVTNPVIQGSATKTLIIDGTTVNFNDVVNTTSNITAQVAWENAFNTSWTINTGQISAEASNRINDLQALKVQYISATNPSGSDWIAFMTSYYSQSDAGLNLSFLLSEHATASVTYITQLESFIARDVTVINNVLNRTYVAADVISGVTVIPAQDITDTQNAVDNGAYMTGFKNYMLDISNAGSLLQTFTVVTTENTTGFKVYQLNDIVQEITSAGVPNVTASAVGSILRLTKTTTTPTNAFSLTVSVGTANSDVGFSGVTETINATSTSTITNPNLTLSQVVNQINTASITGVTAQVASNGTSLQINCNLATLFIGSGTANGVIGLTAGVIPASTTTTTTAVSLNLTDIIGAINNASISGVTASNNNNRLGITSNNATLVIGAGTSNNDVGLTAQTYSAVQGTVSNVFNAVVNGTQVFKEMPNDPNIFSIWVADNSDQGNFNKGYAVYQTMDFGMYASRACAGITADDDAQITVTRYPNTVTQAHNLQAGDYVFITGSTTVPNIDGIHKVTGADPNNANKFFIDEFIEQEGGTGNIYPLRNLRFSDFASLQQAATAQVNGVYTHNFAGIRQNNTNTPIYAYVDRISTSDDRPAVYRWTGTFNDSVGHINGQWLQVRIGDVQARNDLVENVKIYDAITETTIAQLETYDPAKGILFGFIQEEIDYIFTADVAGYNYNTIDGSIPNTQAWGSAQVGKRWWNLNTAIYLDYEQGSTDYRQNNWGKLFDGASIDVYEWTRSTVLPEQWSENVQRGLVVDGRVASGEAYNNVINGEELYNWVEESYYNPKTRRTETYFYFWVKNKINHYGNRDYNTYQLSVLLSNPNSFDIAWCAGSGSNVLFVSNAQRFLTKNSVAQLNLSYESNAMPLQEWTLISEDDPDQRIPEYLHIKIRDSLAGFNNYKERFDYTTWSNTTIYTADVVVQEGTNFYLSVQGSNQNNQPSLDTAQSYWSRIYDFDTVESTQGDDIDVWRGQMLPDLNLHKHNRYGHLIRPRQSLYRDLVEARQNFVYKLNELLGEILLVDEMQDWEQVFYKEYVKGIVTYKTSKYWNFADWRLVERDHNDVITFEFDTNIVADVAYNDYPKMIADTSQSENTYALVKVVPHSDGINRPETYRYDGTQWKLVHKQKATIAFSEEVWNQSKFGHGYDAQGFDITPFDSGSSDILSTLFDDLRNKVFINTHRLKYNKLWFSCLLQAVLQNTTSDFAFKTTYVKLKVQHPVLTNRTHYERYHISIVEDYLQQIKPFHTKVHSVMDSNTLGEGISVEIDDKNHSKMLVEMRRLDHSLRSWQCDIILNGGDFGYTPGNEDVSLFTTVDADYDIIYNGNKFDQPACEWEGDELYPVDYTENISIAVQTNAQGMVIAGPTHSVAAQENNPRGITFNNDGTKMFVIGAAGDDVNEYTLSTGFDLSSTVTFIDSYAVTQCPNPTAVKFNTDGTKMFVTGTGNNNVHEYALSTGFDVSTASFTQTLVTTVDNDHFGLDFKDDGTKMYITGNQNDKIYEFDLSSAFDISTATFNQDLYLGATDFEPFGIEFNPTGTKMFIVGTLGNGVDLFRLTNPWDISTATHAEFYLLGANPSGIHFNPTGTKMFIVGNLGDRVEEFGLTVPYEFTTSSIATADTRSFRINYYEPMGIEVSNVIVDNKKTVLASDITATATDIPVTNASVLDQPTITTGHGAPNRNGVVWIGTERIEYGAIDDNSDTLKFCVRGTLGTGQKAHTSGDTVINSGNTTKIPALEKFSHYGDNLRMAYNDSGITLADPGITPEHAFIRNAGQGSI